VGSDTKRFGVRITAAGVVSFVIQYRNAQGRSRRMTIGTYGTWTPFAAREEAERLLRIADSGGDPAQARQDERGAITFECLAQEYLDKAEKGLIVTRARRRKKPGTVAIDKCRMKHLTNYFGIRPVKDIGRSDCQRLLEKLMEGKHGAARTLGLLGGLLSYAIDRQYITQNPAWGIAKPADGRREFRLDAEGYRTLGVAIETAEARAETWQAVAAIRLIALTGCRKGEILQLKRAEIDIANRCLRLRDTKTTSNETAPSVRPLSEAPGQAGESVCAARPVRPAQTVQWSRRSHLWAWERTLATVTLRMGYAMLSRARAMTSSCRRSRSRCSWATQVPRRARPRGDTSAGQMPSSLQLPTRLVATSGRR
jgi:hypothetical protein